jgi:glycolate oxidase iron-sulfur subunit
MFQSLDRLASAAAVVEGVRVGDLALHAGETADAASIARDTRNALEALDADTVLVSASGCLGSLRDHGLVDSRLQIVDISAFIANHEAIDALRFTALDQRAVLHLPCTQLNVGSGASPVRDLVARIPGLQIAELPLQPRCCGAAGSYFLEHPGQADRLRSEKLDQILGQAPDVVLTTNIGCRIFLGNGLQRCASSAPVLHPLALLARQLETASS